MAVMSNKPTDANAIITVATGGLKDKVSLAEGFAADIRALNDAVLDATQAQDDLSTRYTAIRAVVDGGATAFKNRFNNDFEVEKQIDPALITLDLQKAAYCEYARSWVGLMVSLLLAGKQG